MMIIVNSSANFKLNIFTTMTLRPEGDSRKNASQKGTSPQVLSPVTEIPLMAETHFSKYADVFFVVVVFLLSSDFFLETLRP